jgi:hypothetical protein
VAKEACTDSSAQRGRPGIMPLAGKVRYRMKGKVRLAFRGSEVVEAKNMETGAKHTEKEFLADKAKRKGKLGVK